VCRLADIDECATAIGDSCRQHGTCDGFNPPGHFTCTCNTGYQHKTGSESECIGNTVHSTQYVDDECDSLAVHTGGLGIKAIK